LRGAFGMSLKDTVCINPSLTCEGCFAQKECLYYDFYEKKNIAHPYRFDFSLNPRFYDFSLYLFEDATKKLPEVLTAIETMLTKQGLTAKREKFEIAKILCNDIDIYHDKRFSLTDIKPQILKEQPSQKKLNLKLETPLRIKYQGKILRENPTLEMLIYSIHNRLSEIQHKPREKLSFKPTCKIVENNTSFKDITRLSNRQHTKLQMGGILGNLIFDDIDEISFKYLTIGELMGVGKQTVFGLGKIKIQ
jgi:CRISPR/Cas system endoribonuclease Cas6 (RAMP superfamily)